MIPDQITISPEAIKTITYWVSLFSGVGVGSFIGSLLYRKAKRWRGERRIRKTQANRKEEQRKHEERCDQRRRLIHDLGKEWDEALAMLDEVNHVDHSSAVHCIRLWFDQNKTRLRHLNPVAYARVSDALCQRYQFNVLEAISAKDHLLNMKADQVIIPRVWQQAISLAASYANPAELWKTLKMQQHPCFKHKLTVAEANAVANELGRITGFGAVYFGQELTASIDLTKLRASWQSDDLSKEELKRSAMAVLQKMTEDAMRPNIALQEELDRREFEREEKYGELFRNKEFLGSESLGSRKA